MLGCRASSDLAKLINSYVVLLCCCLSQLGFRRGAVTSVPGWYQPKTPGYAGSQMGSPCFAFPALWTRGMQLQRYTDPPARAQDHAWAAVRLADPREFLRTYWDILVLGHQCFLLCLCWFCPPCLTSAPMFAIPAWLDQGCRANLWLGPNSGHLLHSPCKVGENLTH